MASSYRQHNAGKAGAVGGGAERRESGRNRPPAGVRCARVQEPRASQSGAPGGSGRPFEAGSLTRGQ
jgi:hypothetical protein